MDALRRNSPYSPSARWLSLSFQRGDGLDMINPYFVLIALAIDAFGAIVYARQTWRG